MFFLKYEGRVKLTPQKRLLSKRPALSELINQGPNQNICGIVCLISAILITDSNIRHKLRLRNKLPERLVC